MKVMVFIVGVHFLIVGCAYLLGGASAFAANEDKSKPGYPGFDPTGVLPFFYILYCVCKHWNERPDARSQWCLGMLWFSLAILTFVLGVKMDG